MSEHCRRCGCPLSPDDVVWGRCLACRNHLRREDKERKTCRLCKRDLEHAPLVCSACGLPLSPDNGVYDLIKIEREKQIEHGHDMAHDDAHDEGEIACAMSCYALPTLRRHPSGMPDHWPWTDAWWKPSDRISELVKACALGVAEIERLQRLNTPKEDYTCASSGCDWPVNEDDTYCERHEDDD